MSLIKFPTQIKPSRVTVNLERTDEMFQSPVTGIQQVASRGNAFWRWTYEFKDISLSERETVQAFLAKCRGSLNTFKVTDPANYEVRGSISNWVDMYSGEGTDWNTDAGSASNKVNSYFTHSTRLSHHVDDDKLVRFEWRNYVSAANLDWSVSLASSFEAGKSYVQRIKFWQHPDRVVVRASFSVNSGADGYLVQASPRVNSSGQITAPFYLTDVGSHQARTVDWTSANGRVGDHYHYADFRLSKCALVSNSENLLTYSNEFDGTGWSTTRATVDSGFASKSPTGVDSGAWKLYQNNQVNTEGYLSKSVTVSNTPDIYTLSCYAKAAERTELRLRLQGSAGANQSQATFWLNSGTLSNVSATGDYLKASALMRDVGSDWYRCSISCLINSYNITSAIIYPASGTGVAYTNNGSDGVLIFGAQLRKHNFSGHYVPTTATAVVGTDWQTGSKLYVEGLDPEAKIKAGTRFEIVNRFADGSQSERSEFKKITEEVVVHREGWAILPFDPPIRNAPETMRMSGEQGNFGDTMHNPVIFDNPEMTARLLGGTVQYIEKPLQLTDVVFEVIEDLSE
jgi:hypothetical protein